VNEWVQIPLEITRNIRAGIPFLKHLKAFWVLLQKEDGSAF
jgi:hypothetical protein